jgi:hypothetical protein
MLNIAVAESMGTAQLSGGQQLKKLLMEGLESRLRLKWL